MKKNNCQAQIDLSEKMMKKIEDTLTKHVKHNESKVVSKEEIKALKSQMPLIISMHDELKKLPEPSLKELLKTIDAIQSNLELITGTINSTKSKIEELQQDVISQSSDVLYYSI